MNSRSVRTAIGRLATGIPLVAILVVLAPYLWPPDQAPGSYFSDLHHQHGPNLRLLADLQRRDGELPRWNPEDFAGTPIVGDPQAGLYNPVYRLLLLLDPSLHAMGLMMVAYAMVGAIGFMLYARTIGCSLPAAAVGATAFTLGGKILLHLVLPGHTVKAPFFLLPLLVWALHRLACRPSTHRIVAGGVLGALLVTGLHPQVLFYSAWLVLVLGVAAALAAPRPGRSLLALVASGVLALGLSAVHWLPFFGLMDEFSRAHPALYDVARWDAAHPEARARWTDLIGGTSVSWEGHYYFGGVTLWLMLMGLTAWPRGDGRRRLAWLHGALAAIYLLYGLGAAGWIQPLLSRLPGFGDLRLPARALIVLGFPVAVLAALGVDALVLAPASRRRWAMLGTGTTVATLLIVSAGATATPSPAIPLLLLALAIVAGAALPVLPASTAAQPWREAGSIAAALCLPLAVALDTGRIVRPWVQTSPEAASRHLAPGLTMPADVGDAFRIAEVGRDTVSPGIPELAKRERHLDTLAGYNSLIPWRFILYASYASGYDPVQHNIGDTVPIRPVRRRLFDLLGVTHYLQAPGVPGAPWRWERSPSAFPRAYFATGPIVVSEAEGPEGLALEARALERLASIDPTSSVLLHGAGAVDALAAAGVLPGVPLEPHRALPLESRTANRIVLETAPTHPAILVLNEPFFRGWRAWDNHRPMQILRANVLFRALILPPGAHRIVLEFSPLSWRVGWWISAASACAAVVIVLLGTISRASPRPPETREAASIER